MAGQLWLPCAIRQKSPRGAYTQKSGKFEEAIIVKFYPAVVTLTFCFWSVIADAHEYGNSTVQVVRPVDLSKPRSHVPGSAHSHVRQNQGYGKGYRYGHSVNGPMGAITIWSADPYKAYSSSPTVKSTKPSPRSTKMTGPELNYRPGYGKKTKPGYGQ